MTDPKLASPERITVYIDPDLEDIIPTFLANRQKDLQTLHTAMTEKDFETIRILGHRMRGDGGGYGFNAISDIGGVMELAAGRRDEPAIQRQTAALENFLSRVHIIYRA
ncbi:MAG: Hpt domain-containing protein [Nitrospira sp.]|nr:Hpt domain-containing protein [Nitrospira sp.]